MLAVMAIYPDEVDTCPAWWARNCFVLSTIASLFERNKEENHGRAF